MCACPSEINWADYVDKETVYNAWKTYVTFFAKKMGHVDEQTFRRYVDESPQVDIPLEKLFDKKAPFKMENVSLDRLKARSPEEAYPTQDRPRGKEDISSVRYLCTTDDLVSPIVAIRKRTARGKRQVWILLDGMHRMVASALRSGVDCAVVRALVIDTTASP